MPFPRPDNTVEIVAECWMFIDSAVSRTSNVGARTVGNLLASISDFICDRCPSHSIPRYLDIVGTILDYKRVNPVRTSFGIVNSQIEWYQIGLIDLY